MSKLVIRNIGPIVDIDIELNKVNVIIGPQSSGKSTIAKIYSFCSWYEKSSILTPNSDIDFYNRLISFHNLDDSYFNEISYILYESKYSQITFNGNTRKAFIKILIGPQNIFQNKKIEYFPAERNFVSAIPGLGKYKETNNNILNFLYDWFDAKQEITIENPFSLSLSSIDLSYYYEKKSDSDFIKLKNNHNVILQHSSSGLQSITPLMVVLDYVLNVVYKKDRIISPFESINITSQIQSLKSDALEENEELMKFISQINDLNNRYLGFEIGEKGKYLLEELISIQKGFIHALGIENEYQYSQAIIEEPEQNLFPETQKELIYHIIKLINNNQHNHQLLMTTHSPYILYALNNCMVGYMAKKNMPEDRINELYCKESFINPLLVSIWEIKEGYLIGADNKRNETIQLEDGLLGDNYFDRNMNSVMDDFYKLITYYENDQESHSN